MAIIQDIPFLSQDATWEGWNGAMLHYFGEEPLPRVQEEDWQSFAAAVVGLPTFSTYGIPDGQGLSDWRDWASQLVALVNGATE